MTTRTTNLGLILEDGITAAARANLLRLDTLAGALNLLNTQSVQLRAAQDLVLQPADVALGGTPGQGSFAVGSADNFALTFKAHSTGQAQFDAPSVGLRQPGSPARWLGLAYAAAGGATADRVLTFDTVNASRTLRLGADLTITPTAGATGLVLSISAASTPTITVPATGTLVLQDLVQALTGKTLDGSLNTFLNLPTTALVGQIPATQVGTGTVNNTELGYLDGVTSSVQTQLNSKQPTGAYVTALSGDVVAAGPGTASAVLQAGVVDTGKLANSAVTDAKVSASAAIAGTKIAPDFGAQRVDTSGGLRLKSGANYVDIVVPTLVGNSLISLPTADGTLNQVLQTNGAGQWSWRTVAGTGTVTSVALTAPSIFTVAGSPITGTGTLAFTLNTQTAGTIFAGPVSGVPGVPAFRAFVIDDLPANIPYAKLEALTASRALVSSVSGAPTASATTATELGYLAGVTAAVQTQLDAKQATGSYLTALTGDIAASGPGSAAATIQAGAVTDAKIATVSGSKVTGNIPGNAANVTGIVAKVNGGTGADNSSVTFPASGVLVTEAGTQTLTNKTLTAPAISSPTGLVKADVGLGNVDNTSDATKNAAVATLTNKTLTSPVISTPTGIVKGDVGLGNVDNTSDATKNAATATLTNKRVSSTTDMTGALELPSGSVAQRPTPVAGHIRLNTDANEFEGFSNGAWQSVGGGVNEQPLKNYLKAFATASVGLGTVGTGVVTATGNRASGTTAWASTNTANISLAQSASTTLRGSFNYLFTSGGTPASATGGTFVETPVFTLEGTDLGKPVSISFDLTGVTADGNFDVAVVRYNSAGTYQETIPVAGNASGATVRSAKLPTGTGTFRGFFVTSSTATDLYALRFRRLAGTDVPRIDTLYVGPQAQLLGFAGTDEQTYTPTFAGVGTPTINRMVWSRVGQRLFVEGRFTTGVTTANIANMALPNGLTALGGDSQQVGVWYRNATAGSTRKTGAILMLAGDNKVYFTSADYTVSLSPYSAQFGSDLFASSEIVNVKFDLPITTFTSNVTMAERALESYASHDGTSVVTGIAGAVMPVTDLTDVAAYDVTSGFANSQATDSFVFEIQSGGTGPWVKQIFGVDTLQFNTGTTASYGAGHDSTGSTVRLLRGRYARGTTAWSAASVPAGTRWRVKRVSSGAAVGFPIGTRNAVRDTTGTAIAAGLLNEQLSQARLASGALALTTLTIANVTATALTLQPGTYDLSGFAGVTGSATSATQVIATISTTSAALGSQDGAYVVDGAARNLSTSDFAVPLPVLRVNITVATTYYLTIRATFSGGTASAYGRIQAVGV